MVSITAEDQPNKTRQMLAFGALSVCSASKNAFNETEVHHVFSRLVYSSSLSCRESLTNSARRKPERGERGWAEGQGRAQLAGAAAGAAGWLSSGPQRETAGSAAAVRGASPGPAPSGSRGPLAGACHRAQMSQPTRYRQLRPPAGRRDPPRQRQQRRITAETEPSPNRRRPGPAPRLPAR